MLSVGLEGLVTLALGSGRGGGAWFRLGAAAAGLARWGHMRVNLLSALLHMSSSVSPQDDAAPGTTTKKQQKVCEFCGKSGHSSPTCWQRRSPGALGRTLGVGGGDGEERGGAKALVRKGVVRRQEEVRRRQQQRRIHAYLPALPAPTQSGLSPALFRPRRSSRTRVPLAR